MKLKDEISLKLKELIKKNTTMRIKNMKYNIDDTNDDLLVISDLDAMFKKVVNEFGDEAIFLNPYCIQCGDKIDIKIDNFTFYQAEVVFKILCQHQIIPKIVS